MSRGVWKPALKAMAQLLKPGGAIQWVEGDASGVFKLPPGPNGKDPVALRRTCKGTMGLVKQQFASSRQGMADGFHDPIMGLHDVRFEEFDPERQPEIIYRLHLLLLETLISIGEGALQSGGALMEGVTNFDELMELAKHAKIIEIDDGAHGTAKVYVGTAFKDV